MMPMPVCYMDPDGNKLDDEYAYMRCVVETADIYGSCYVEVVADPSCWLMQVVRPSDIMVMRDPDRHANIPVAYNAEFAREILMRRRA